MPKNPTNAHPGAVAAGHPETANAAMTILRAGGNAYDAVWAAFCMACVCEPVLASLGGGGFLLVKPHGQPPRVFDAFTHTPRAFRDHRDTDFHPIVADFGSTTQEFHIGQGSIATPGIVKGMFESHQQLGRLPVQTLMEPAIIAAREGIQVNPLQAYICSLVEPILTLTDASRALYASPQSSKRTLESGQLFRNPELADVLDCLSREGAALFYRGDIAHAIAQSARDNSGHLSADDLKHYKVIQRDPILHQYRDHQLITNPPPSSGGLLISFALALLEAHTLSPDDRDSLAFLSTLARVMEQTDLVRKNLHTEQHQDAYIRLMDPDLIEHHRLLTADNPLATRGTSHISVIDGEGNAAALTVSNGEGCGHILPGTGIMLNNMLGEEDVNPAGFHQWPRDRRMASMMAPSLLLSPDGAITITGSGGSNRIRTAILQTLINIVDFDMDITAAVAAPRIHLERGRLGIEAGYPDAVVRQLCQQYPDHHLWTGRNLFFGGTHTLRRHPDGRIEGAGDPRRGGVFLHQEPT